MAKPKSTSKRGKKSPAQVQAPAPGPDLYSFTLGFFEFFGAQIHPQNHPQSHPQSQPGKGHIQVGLPPELAEHFTKPTLNLVFKNAELTSDTDLVAYGSRVFDRMMTYLDRQGALTVQQLPRRFAGGEELMRAVQPTNAAILNLKLQESVQDLFIFNWHITYRADDKREEIFTVLLDETGERLRLETAPGADSPSLADLLADAQPPPPEVDESGQPQPPKLPPMTHLIRHAQSARKYALYHADLRCVDHEQEILPRLHKVLSRLTNYYEEQIREVYDSHDPTGEKRMALEEDLRRKIAEEVENHRLRVKVRLFSYALLRTPIASADLTLGVGRLGSAERQEVTVRVWRNLYDGAMHRPTCHACGQETATVTLDRNGHVTCDACLRQCHTCQDVLCERCGVAPCSVCGEGNCDTCSQMCWACGERSCPDHSSVCPVCGDTVCHSCQTECAECGVRQCRSHLRADGVTQALVCNACAIRCPNCNQYSAQLATCSTSGQRFCTNCTATCVDCGQIFGPGYFQLDMKTGTAYCMEHVRTCSNCGAFTGTLWACSACAAACCPACGQQCSVCRDPLCADHTHRHTGCNHVTCATHVSTCAIGHEQVCPICADECAICERPHCAEHTQICAMCHQAYCTDCVRRSGLCDTCAMLEKEGIPVRMQDEPISGHKDVAPLIEHYQWIRLANHRYTIFLGRGVLGIQALIVARQKRVLSVRRQSPLDRILGRGWS